MYLYLIKLYLNIQIALQCDAFGGCYLNNIYSKLRTATLSHQFTHYLEQED